MEDRGWVPLLPAGWPKPRLLWSPSQDTAEQSWPVAPLAGPQAASRAPPLAAPALGLLLAAEHVVQPLLAALLAPEGAPGRWPSLGEARSAPPPATQAP